MERKLATVLFVDIVGSTELVSGADPEVVRRRVTQFFDHVAGCIERHGGTVEKFAGDAVMAAFGIPQAHEDDAERAIRSALAIVDVVGELGLQARIGIEAGEVVAEATDSTFATGEPVTLAARLQQAAGPNEILVGRGAYRLAAGTIDLQPVDELELRGVAEPVPAWRAVEAYEIRRPLTSLSAPLVGRDAELELLQNTFERAVRDRRAHLFTIYGEPGVGKSRLARDFAAGLEGVTLLMGRCLPYGEGITYWPLAEMVRAAAGIADDDSAAAVHEKLVVCCEDEAVADLLALAAGVLEAVEGERSGQEISWASREWSEQLATAQPLVLVFEDIHWAEEPLLELIEYLTSWVREAPLLIVCLARPELLDVHPSWGGGRVRATAIELEPLARNDSELLVDALLADSLLPDRIRSELLEKTEGNPLFVEETIRMLSEGDGDGPVSIPDTLQAIIAARIDRLPSASKRVLQRASVIGRVFWHGAVEHLSPDVEELDEHLDDLLLRDFLSRETRSTISGERAYRFKHVLIREVAYGGVSKWSRAEHHRRFAGWLHERAGEELLEIRAFHLGRAASLHAELDGSPPAELAAEAAAALEGAGRLAVAREATHAARKLFLHAVELEPTLERRFLAARAAWRLDDLPAVSVEMELVRSAAKEVDDRRIEARALVALGEVTAARGGDLHEATRLVEEALELLEPDDLVGRFDALRQRHTLAKWVGDTARSREYAEKAYEAARATGRKDLRSAAARSLAGVFMVLPELERAQELVSEALALAEETGGVAAKGQGLHLQASIRDLQGDYEAAIELYEESIVLLAEAGVVRDQARSQNHLADLLLRRGETARAEKVLREAIRILKPLEDRSYLCESQRLLAEVLLRRGRIEEAERLALAARETVAERDVTSLASTRMALALVRSAQGRDSEAETLLREAVALLDEKGLSRFQCDPAVHLARFLRERGRDEEALVYERLAGELVPAATPSTAA